MRCAQDRARAKRRAWRVVRFAIARTGVTCSWRRSVEWNDSLQENTLRNLQSPSQLHAIVLRHHQTATLLRKHALACDWIKWVF